MRRRESEGGRVGVWEELVVAEACLHRLPAKVDRLVVAQLLLIPLQHLRPGWGGGRSVSPLPTHPRACRSKLARPTR